MTASALNSNNLETEHKDPLGNVWTTTYDSKGNIIGMIDPLGYRTTIQRDVYNSPTTVIYADGGIVSTL